MKNKKSHKKSRKGGIPQINALVNQAKSQFTLKAPLKPQVTPVKTPMKPQATPVKTSVKPQAKPQSKPKTSIQNKIAYGVIGAMLQNPSKTYSVYKKMNKMNKTLKRGSENLQNLKNNFVNKN